MRISDWSSDVCSSDLRVRLPRLARRYGTAADAVAGVLASCAWRQSAGTAGYPGRPAARTQPQLPWGDRAPSAQSRAFQRIAWHRQGTQNQYARLASGMFRRITVAIEWR